MDIKKYVKFFKGLIEKPFIVYDVETTGTNCKTDQIISLAAVKIKPNGTYEEFEIYCKPTVAISAGATEVHGFDKDNTDHFASFESQAESIFEFFKDCDVGGYNSDRLDAPMLIRQMEEAGYPNFLQNACHYDAFKVYKQHDPRKLANALKFYAGLEIENAHDAMADVKSTVVVVAEQLKKEGLDPKAIVTKMDKDSDDNKVSRFIEVCDNNYKISFGKYAGSFLDKVPKDYLEWIVKKSTMPNNLKDWLKRYLNKEIQSVAG